MTTVPSPSATPNVTRPKTPQAKAVGPRLQILLYVVFGLLAVLLANSVYLAGVTFLEYVTRRVYQDYFYQIMFLAHVVLGLVFIAPFVAFGAIHMVNTWRRKKRRAVYIGMALFAVSLVVLGSGLLLLQLEGFAIRGEASRRILYWLHVLLPLVAVWLYWLHRLAGTRMKWRLGLMYAGVVGASVLGMIWLQYQDPRRWNEIGPKEGTQYFEPSLARTTTGKFIPADVLMMDQYCLKCHQDSFKGWFHSSHHFSSFNNPVYLAAIRETRQVALKRDGNVKASRWCAGCHDTVPFFSGAFDDPNYDLVKHPTSQAGLTCTSCHSITHVNTTRGNADFTIEEPLHYPFAQSENPVLQWVNNQLIKAKPEFHKKTFLKPFHKTAEFCSTCHKVSLPKELNNYKEFLRGQNHYDAYLLSGVSGHGARSFYYPDKAKTNCSACHMPLVEAEKDLSAKDFAKDGKTTLHNHLFPAANTGLAHLKKGAEGFELDAVKAHAEFLKGTTRVDIFAVREGDSIDAPAVAPLRPNVPALKPGGKYVLETVVRTLKLGHLLTQGTVDSNELWVDVTVKSGERIIGRNGGQDQRGEVDRYSHFVNVFLLDKDGNRINRRNPQDIFWPLYNHQIPPGAAAVVHYGLEVPADVVEPVTVEVKLQYRKFDRELMDFATQTAQTGDRDFHGFAKGQANVNTLPIVTMAADKCTFPVTGGSTKVENPEVKIDLWQRWNDYGIGMLLKGPGGTPSRNALKQASEAFAEVEKLGRYDGPLNLARVYVTDGRLDQAVEAAGRAARFETPAPPPWTLNWLSGVVNRQQNHYAAAEANLRSVLDERTPEMLERGFDFSLDYEVINELGQVYFDWAKSLGPQDKDYRSKLEQARMRFESTLAIDSENVAAHYNLHQLYQLAGDKEKSKEHLSLYERFKPDDQAIGVATGNARRKYPAANFAAEAIVIYPLNRPDAPELPAVARENHPAQNNVSSEGRGEKTAVEANRSDKPEPKSTPTSAGASQ